MLCPVSHATVHFALVLPVCVQEYPLCTGIYTARCLLGKYRGTRLQKEKFNPRVDVLILTPTSTDKVLAVLVKVKVTWN